VFITRVCSFPPLSRSASLRHLLCARSPGAGVRIRIKSTFLVRVCMEFPFADPSRFSST
jgi:hypothetical protein